MPTAAPACKVPEDSGLYYDNLHPVIHSTHGLAISASGISKVIRYIIYTRYDWNTLNTRDDSFIQKKNYLVSTSLNSNKTFVYHSVTFCTTL